MITKETAEELIKQIRDSYPNGDWRLDFDECVELLLEKLKYLNQENEILKSEQERLLDAFGKIQEVVEDEGYNADPRRYCGYCGGQTRPLYEHKDDCA